ncbi:MAG: hypothetical protein ACK58L_17355 [Planctomycetota bacterium]
MSEVRFAGTGQDRRRRMLVADLEPLDDSDSPRSWSAKIEDSHDAAFPLLSRDDVMRKMISPRLWKHHVVACLLLAMPFLIAGFRLPGQDRDHVEKIDTAIRGLCGLELFISSQLCLLIGWVRSASAVDFAGIFRAWRWLSLVLLASALLIVTDLTESVTGLLGNWLEPLIGSVQAARPALLFVPLCASSVYVLRHILPDMSRCRMAQGSMALAALLMLTRIALSVRGPMLSSTTMELWELLICGLILSSVHMHGRYVIYVNPNPPAARKAIAGNAAHTRHRGHNEPVATSESAAIPLSITSAAETELASATTVSCVELNETLHQRPETEDPADAETNAESVAHVSEKKTTSKAVKNSKARRPAG